MRPIYFFAVALLAATSCGSPQDATQPPNNNSTPPQLREVQGLTPTFSSINAKIFQPKCVRCHSDSNKNAGISLTSLAALTASAATHGDPIVVMGHPDQSHLYMAVSSGEMPPNGKLSDPETQAIRMWIEQGALDN